MNYTDKVINIIDNLEFTDKQNKEIIKNRFVDEVDYYEKKRNKTGSYYNIFRFIVTTGSILLPAILSIGQMDPNKLPKNFDQITYWSSWSISLIVTISNGFLQLFSLDKNYFNYSLTVEQLKTEGWQFFGLSGKYEDYKKHDMKSYKTFCKNIENIKRKQIENEYNGKADSKKKNFDFAGEFLKFKKQMKKSGNIKDDTDSDEEDVEDPKKPPPINKSSQQVPPPIPNRDHDEEGNNANENDNLVQETVTDAPKLV